MRCSLGQRVISPECHLDVPTILDRMRSLPEESRRCSDCAELVLVRPFPNNNPNGPPFDKAVVVGCETMIDAVIERFIEEFRSVVEFNLTDCLEGKKSQDASGAAH